MRSVGESSDIVTKEMYRFEDKGSHDVCMRPEGTAGVVRSYINSKYDRQGTKARYYYYGQMFRYERPQKGRLRSFHQFGCESFGYGSFFEDFNIISLIAQILQELGIEATLKLNSLGCSECMGPYKNELVAFLKANREGLCKECDVRIEKNPIRVLDCKNEQCKSLLKDAPLITDRLCNSCKSDLDSLKDLLQKADISYEIDPALVRGLDYYTKSAFEFVSSQIGAQSAMAGGGRYDRLVEELGGKSTPAIGFAIGIERIMDLVYPDESALDGYYLGAMSADALERCMLLGTKLKKRAKVEISYETKGFKSHMKGVQRSKARYALFIGEDELKDDLVWIKDIKTQEQKRIKASSLL